MRNIARVKLDALGINPEDPTISALLEVVFDVLVANNNEIDLAQENMSSASNENFTRLNKRLIQAEERLSKNDSDQF